MGRTLVVGDERAERGEGGLGADVVAATVVERSDLVVLHERDAAARLVLVAHAQREVPRVCTHVRTQHSAREGDQHTLSTTRAILDHMSRLITVRHF